MAVTGTWASTTDVSDYTGKTVTSTQLNIAQTMIEGLIGRVYRSTDSTTSSYYWLSRAVAYQAAYLSEHPEIVTQQNIGSLSQDGFSVTFVSADGTPTTLALYSPVALKQLNNIFHGSNSSVRFNSAFQKTGTSYPRWKTVSRW